MYVIENLKDYYTNYQSVFGETHVRQMIAYAESYSINKDSDELSGTCIIETDKHISNIQQIPLCIKTLKHTDLDKYRRASFLHRIRIKIARRELYNRFTSFYHYSDFPDERPYYIQKAIDRMIAKYQKSETQVHIKRDIIRTLYSCLSKDLVDYIIKPYLGTTF